MPATKWHKIHSSMREKVARWLKNQAKNLPVQTTIVLVLKGANKSKNSCLEGGATKMQVGNSSDFLLLRRLSKWAVLSFAPFSKL